MAAERNRIGLREVRALAPGEIIWDAAVRGFGARRQKGPAVGYFLFYRTAEGRQRWYTIGRHGAPWTPDMAREKAREILGEVAKGGDPASQKRAVRTAATVSELCEMYLADAEAGRILTGRKVPKKAATLVIDRGRIARHINPLIGKMAVPGVTREDIERFLHAVAEGETAARIKTGRYGLARVTGGKSTASRTIGLLGAIFTYAMRRKMCTENPVRGVIRFEDGERNRRMSDDEYAAFGEALRKAKSQQLWPPAIAAAKFLAVSGWRTGEAVQLRWADIDFPHRTAQLPDTKTDRQPAPCRVPRVLYWKHYPVRAIPWYFRPPAVVTDAYCILKSFGLGSPRLESCHLTLLRTYCGTASHPLPPTLATVIQQ
jgi:hypothetical protein